jgi:Secretion system C-terminal sorting domain/Immune inhibitor A-like, MAM domain
MIMSKSIMYILTLAILLIAVSSFAVTSLVEQELRSDRLVHETTTTLNLDEIIWNYDFEDTDLSDWIFYDPIASPQNSHWSVDLWEPHGGENSWRCFDPEVGSDVFGGYDNDWMQMLALPIQDFTNVTAATLDFWFRCVSESGWDGATMFITYGPDEENLTYEITTSNAGFGDYDETNMTGFTTWWPGLTVPGWANVPEYTNANFDLSDYAGYAYVRIAFAFASDGAYCSSDDISYFGFQIDDIVLNLDGTDTFTNDAESGLGGMFIITGGAASTFPPVPNVFGLFEPEDAPSATHALGIETYDPSWVNFDHYMECPLVYDAQELQTGESAYLDIKFKGDWEGEGTFPDVPFWFLEIYDPYTQTWGHGGWNPMFYAYTFAPDEWSSIEETYGDHRGMNTVGNLEGIKFRIRWRNVQAGMLNDHFGGMYWDDLVIVKTWLEHDIATTFGNISYPTTVGYPVIGEVNYTNNGSEDETFVGLWGFDPPTWPVFPDGEEITLPSHLVSHQYINTLNSSDGAWIPTSSGETTISASHTLTSDQIPENDLVTLNLNILEENHFELGYDFRRITHFSTDNPVGGGPITFFTPVTDEIVDPTTHIFNIVEYQFRWYGNQGNGEINIHVGTTAGASDIWASGPIGLVADAAIMDFVLDLSGTTELEGLTGDFYVWTELLTAHADGHGIPSPLRTISEVTYNDHHFDYDGTTATETDSDWNVNVVIEAVERSIVDPSDALPSEFALNNAYPNPFNPTTMLTYDVASLSNVNIKVYNLMGQEIATLYNGTQTIGRHSVSFDASNLSSGVYFVRMQTDGFNAMQKILLMK